jgi:outer membrane immunogenic protein
MLKQLALASMLIVSASIAALAADIEAPPEDFDWTGFYIGGHLGYGEPSFDGFFDISEAQGEGGTEEPLPEETTYADDLDADGFVFGAQAGYNYQSGKFLLGIEADVSFLDFEDEVADNEGNDIIEVDLDFLASLRLRGGAALDRVLVYATGGVAYAGGEYTLIDDAGTGDENSGDVDIDAFGGVVGGGLEWAVTDGLSLRAEGLYFFFDDEEDTSDVTNDSDPDDFLELEDVWMIRGGINLLL